MFYMSSPTEILFPVLAIILTLTSWVMQKNEICLIFGSMRNLRDCGNILIEATGAYQNYAVNATLASALTLRRALNKKNGLERVSFWAAVFVDMGTIIKGAESG